ncbi:MAG: hypothetical protein A3J28_10940 [Acidobacteria bacterium RIFCSPLOWO2_12_FULL_60_22]|nr:MAG: hypothetical protein A3J28_10940 [Acidobacteria bacterium RIFCSPLOWO2_12_FULL_60_22]
MYARLREQESKKFKRLAKKPLRGETAAVAGALEFAWQDQLSYIGQGKIRAGRERLCRIRLESS